MGGLQEKIISRPTFCGFSPDVLPYHREVVQLVYNFDYSKSNIEILLSGSYGSGKSLLMAHLAVSHCLRNKGARVALGRRAMPDLKRTIWREILDHISEDFNEGEHYEINRASHTITWCNGSEIICLSWADQLYAKFRSLKLSMFVVEEIIESNDDEMEAFKQIKARLRRIPHVKENVLIAATNPDSPGSWVYKYFIEGSEKYDSRRIFYSRTELNPFLDPAYINQLKQDLSPKEAERYLEGKWIEIAGEVVYYEYRTSEQFRRYDYKVDPSHPVIFSWDFNIGEGKPMSLVLMQYIADELHVFDEVIVHGARTADTLDEAAAKGYFRPEWEYMICGDAAGKNRDTRSVKSDYDIIRGDFDRRGLKYQYLVPPANPPIRTRHNRVNAYCRNAAGQTRLWVYEKAKTVDEGLRLVKMKKGANIIEDDSKSYQHCTTALGYALVMISTQAARPEQRTTIL
jgi:hypothetical protein